MATQTRSTNIFRPEFIVHSLNLKYTDATATYNFDMGPGAYYVNMIYYTVAQFAGSSGTVSLSAVKPAIAAAQATLSDSAFTIGDANTIFASASATITMNRSTDYRRYVGLVGVFGNAIPIDGGPWDLPYGLSITWTNGLSSGSAGELQVHLICGRIS